MKYKPFGCCAPQLYGPKPGSAWHNMVGTPRSLGCQTCRKRKKKCTQERPECSQCLKAGWRCPGYFKQWKFVDEGSQIAGRHRRRRFQGTVTFSGGGGFEMYEAERMGHASLYVGLIFRSISSETEKTSLVLASIVANDRAQALLPLHALGSFFPLIPARLGRNSALDTTVTCLCSIYHRFLRGESTLASKATIGNYVDSLAALQRCVSDPGLRYQSETLCASILVQLCELMTSKNTGRWNNLSRGCGLLFKESDPDRFASGFDRTLLESQRAMFIVQDMHAGENCFLAQPQWREVLNSNCGPKPPSHKLEAIELRNALCDALVDFPGMAQEEKGLLTSPAAHWEGSHDLTRLDSAIHRVLRMQDCVNSWYNVFAQSSPYDANQDPIFIAGSLTSRLDCLDGTDRPNLLYAILDCVANTVLARLDRMLLHLSSLQRGISADGCLDGASLARAEARRQRARAIFEIVKSRSSVSAKPLYFGLRQIWLEEWLV